MTQHLLRGLRALDLTTPIGSACGRILASFGVDVVRIDAPSTLDGAGSTEPNTWRAANLGKRSIELDIELPADRERFRDLVRQADFVIESFQPGRLHALELDYKRLAAINPAIILVSISTFGQNGPYAAYRGGELVASAMGGVLITLGDPDRAPVKEALDANCFHGSAGAALGAVMAYYHRRKSGRGQHVDQSIQEAAVSRNTNNLLLYQFDKRCVQRGGAFLRFGKASIRVVWKLRDGFMFWSMATGRFGAPANRALSAWIDELGYDNPMRAIDWDKYDRSTLNADVRKSWEAALQNFFADRTKTEIDSEGRRRGINAAVANEIGDLLNDRQLNARSYFAPIAWSDDGKQVQVPRYFVRSGHEASAPLAPSALGADSSNVTRDWRGA
jgi:crotonobetainyl-CoA:carnitine CoA-transferase CaiB-like acyl-CoA transferase